MILDFGIFGSKKILPIEAHYKKWLKIVPKHPPGGVIVQ